MPRGRRHHFLIKDPRNEELLGRQEEERRYERKSDIRREAWVESYRVAYDFCKHMTTLNTGSVLLISTLKGVFFDPNAPLVFLIGSFAGFVFSLIFSVIAMTMIAYQLRLERRVPVWTFFNLWINLFVFGVLTSFIIGIVTLVSSVADNMGLTNPLAP